MAALEERVACLEGHVEHYPRMFVTLREDMARIGHRSPCSIGRRLQHAGIIVKVARHRPVEARH